MHERSESNAQLERHSREIAAILGISVDDIQGAMAPGAVEEMINLLRTMSAFRTHKPVRGY